MLSLVYVPSVDLSANKTYGMNNQIFTYFQICLTYINIQDGCVIFFIQIFNLTENLISVTFNSNFTNIFCF